MAAVPKTELKPKTFACDAIILLLTCPCSNGAECHSTSTAFYVNCNFIKYCPEMLLVQGARRQPLLLVAAHLCRLGTTVARRAAERAAPIDHERLAGDVTGPP